MMIHSLSTRRLLFKAICFTTLLFGLVYGDDVISKFFANYDKALRPDFENDKPTIVHCSLYVESFGNIEEANMEYKVYTYFRQYWKDPRLAGKLNRTLVLKGGDIANIWVPDPYCYNARESNMMVPDEETHSNVKIDKSGNIRYSRGVTLLASCIMDLHEFPLDAQECTLKFGSYGHTTKDIIFKWVPGETNVTVGNKEMAQFEYKGSKLENGEDTFDSGNFSTMTAVFLFDRRMGYYLIQVYFPDIFVVTLSWIVFWMEKDDMGNRMALGITTILTIMFLLGSLNGTLPKVSYPKALDWYLLVSFSFVFLSLVECMIVFLFASGAKHDDEQIKYKKNDVPLTKRISTSLRSVIGHSKDDVNGATVNNGGVIRNIGSNDDLEMVCRATKANKTVMADGTLHGNKSSKYRRREKIAENIDKTARVLFPLAFLIYNIFYWTYY